MNQLDVHYCGWGEDWHLGRLADDGVHLLFEYTPHALQQNLELSPIHLPLRVQAYSGFPSHLNRLPGLIADCLPDGWGLLLMDRLFRKRGLRHISALDRLAFMGNRAMGGLRFVPTSQLKGQAPDWNLSELAAETLLAVSGDLASSLCEIAIAGGSPQGARPKALVQYEKSTGKISTSLESPGTPWLVKFPAQAEHKEVCALEQLYAQLARACGIDLPDTQLFDISSKLSAFGAARFDRVGPKRVPLQSLAGLLQLDFRLPGVVDYTGFLRATRALTNDQVEVEKAYARAVFNVLFHNRDDHPKNFAWCMDESRRWKLAPAFDLTFSEGPMGQHHMDVCGEGAGISRDHLLRLARESGVAAAFANQTIDQMLDQVDLIAHLASELPIRQQTVRHVVKTVQACRARLASA